MSNPADVVDDEVLYEVAEHIATITLNAPGRMNTISGLMLDQLSERLLQADRDREVRCIIITGAGIPSEIDLRFTPPFEQNVHHVFLQLLPLLPTDDFGAGVSAYMEKRTPTFAGR